MADSRIDILISARDEAAATIAKVNKELQGLGAGANGAKEAASGLQGIDQAASLATGGVSALGAALGIAGAVKLGQQVVELAQMGAQAQRVDTSFQRMAASAVQSSSQILAAMRKASAGTISDMDLELNANRARVLGVADSAEKLSTLLEIARVRGAAFGRTTAEAFNDLVTGIGRGSAPILDNLGFKDGAHDLDVYAASVGKTTGELTNAERTSVLLNKVISETSGEVKAAAAAGLDAAGSWERLTASLANSEATFGKTIAGIGGKSGGFFADIIDGYTQVLTFIQNNPGIDPWSGKSKEGGRSLFVPITPGLIAEQEAAQQAADKEQHLEDIHASMGEASAIAARQLEGLQEATQREMDATIAAAGATPTLNAALRSTVPAFQIVQDMATATSNNLAALQAQIAGLKNAAIGRLAGASASVAGFTDEAERQQHYNEAVTETKDKIDAVEDAYSKRLITYEEEQRQIAEVNAASTAWFDTTREGHAQAIADGKRLASTYESDVKKAIKDAQAEFDKLAGKVSGVLSGALADVAGVDISSLLVDPKEKDPKKQVSLLPREDTISEDARRLADIAVNGFKSPWYEYFKKEFPALFGQFFGSASGDELGVRQQAAKLVRSFQDGLEPELLDKEKAKERVRKMLIGEQNMAALAKEIATELQAEFGATAPADLAAQVNTALGVGGGAATKLGGGDAAGSAFGAGAADAAASAGNKMISALDATLRADNNVNLIRAAGESAGGNWGSAFMTTVGNNVPKQLIDLITSLVTPQVVAYFNTQTTLTGATP